MRILSTILVLMVWCCGVRRAWDISTPLTTVPYEGMEMQVWENRPSGLFYISPLARLVNNSATVAQNVLTGNVQLSFPIVLASPEYEQVVYFHLKQFFNSSLLPHQIQILPIEKMRLIWKDRDHPFTTDYHLMEEWRAKADSPSVVTFQMWCRNLEKCTALKNAINSQTEIFYALEMEYAVEQATRQNLTVTGEHLRQTQMYSKMATLNEGGTRYLTETDVNALAAQTAAAAVFAAVPDYLDEPGESTLSFILQRILKRRPVWTSGFSTWSSVYWEPGHSRPDKVAFYLNAVLRHDRNDSQSFLVDESKIPKSPDSDACANALGIANHKTNTTNINGTTNSPVHRISKEAVFSALVRGRHNVGWDGFSFRIKPFRLYLLDTQAMIGSGNLTSSEVHIRQHKSVRSVKVRVVPTLNQTVTALNQRLDSIGNLFNNWPEYCYKPNHYCSSYPDSFTRSSAKTVAQCKLACDQFSRCQSFNFYRPGSMHCILFHSVCSYGHFGSNSNYDYYVKLSRVPIINTEMWRTAFTSSRLTKTPTDPCDVIGDYDYTKV